MPSLSSIPDHRLMAVADLAGLQVAWHSVWEQLLCHAGQGTHSSRPPGLQSCYPSLPRGGLPQCRAHSRGEVVGRIAVQQAEAHRAQADKARAAAQGLPGCAPD